MVDRSCIRLENVSLGYITKNEQLHVVKNANLQFFPGELIGIVGLNGSGKSTLLKGLCGALKPFQGKIFIQDQDINKIPLNELAKIISIVLTEKIQGFNLTVNDLVAAGQMPYTNSFHRLESSHLQIIDEAITLTGLNEHRFKPLNELSDGLFQKAVLAKALAQKTPIMLLDEPTAYLDYASKNNLFKLLLQLSHTSSKCILVSSHDLDLLIKYCDKILVISSNGLDLVETGKAKQNPAFIEIGGGYL